MMQEIRDFQEVTMTKEFDRYLFHEGRHYEVYKRMGAHPTEKDGKSGVLFSIWAPRARAISVMGDFNGWDRNANPMDRLDEQGIYETFVPGALTGDLYKYCIQGEDGEYYEKADPYANFAEVRPGTASRVTELGSYPWRDGGWEAKKQRKDWEKEPMFILEVHPGSWKLKGYDHSFYNYRQLAQALAEYVREMGYTHVELMGILEHPFDGSWGYQVTGYFAPTSRYGKPEDFQYLVDYLHRQGIGVILDWVPAHFPKDAHGLARLDGSPVYEYEDPRKGEHPDWGTYVFDYGKKEVRNFLIASAVYWLKEYHVDGLRVDAVSSMLYLDYGRADGQWVPNRNGGKENLEAVSFLQEMNQVVKQRVPGAYVIAEESTAWQKVTGSVEEGGLGFTFKWNMGWMNDVLFYLGKDPIYRKYHHHNLTFGMTYAYSERFILVLSHDEVVHGKGSMLMKLPGTMEEKFQDLRAAYGFFLGHPGKKLLFMGQEFAQIKEWDEKKELDWALLEERNHRGIQEYVKDLLMVYRENPCLYETDQEQDGFRWIEPDDEENSVYVFARRSRDGKNNLLFVVNFTPVERKAYQVGTLEKKPHRLILSSDWEKYGGKTREQKEEFLPKETEAHRFSYSFSFDLAGFGMAIFRF